MKSKILSVLIIFLSLTVEAQIPPVKEGTKTMTEGSFNAFTVSLEEISFNDAEQGWKNLMKQYNATVSKNKKAKLYTSERVQLPSLSSVPIDIYTMIKEEGKGMLSISVWFDTGSGYVNSIDMELQSEVALKLVEEYATTLLKNAAYKDLKNEENRLEELKANLKKLNDKNNDLVKDIAKAKEQIQKWEKVLEQNDDDIVKKKKEIEKQENQTDLAKAKARKFL